MKKIITLLLAVAFLVPSVGLAYYDVTTIPDDCFHLYDDYLGQRNDIEHLNGLTSIQKQTQLRSLIDQYERDDANCRLEVEKQRRIEQAEYERLFEKEQKDLQRKPNCDDEGLVWDETRQSCQAPKKEVRSDRSTTIMTAVMQLRASGKDFTIENLLPIILMLRS